MNPAAAHHSTAIHMARVLFWDVDTQYDFIHPDGKLYVPRAEAILPRLKALTDFAHARGIRIIASADDHQLGHRELSDTPDFETSYPPHCMHGTPGQAKVPETTLRDPLIIEPAPQDPEALAVKIRHHRGDVLFNKHWFDVFTNANVDSVLRVLDPEVIVLYGVALDVCNKYAIEGLLVHRPQTKLYLVTDATKAIRYEVGEQLLRDWGDEGVRLVKTEEVVEDGILEPYLS
jgi:nicotinamidase/pyrazinamidase